MEKPNSTLTDSDKAILHDALYNSFHHTVCVYEGKSGLEYSVGCEPKCWGVIINLVCTLRRSSVVYSERASRALRDYINHKMECEYAR